MANLRFRGKKDPLEKAKNLDAFKKLKDDYIEPSQIGGTLSVISRLLIFYLIYKEFGYFWDSNLIFTFKPDTNMNEKLDLNVDITVAMPCSSIGTGIVDSTNQNIDTFGSLDLEDTWFELEEQERNSFEEMRHLNQFLREEYYSIAEIIFKGIIKNSYNNANTNTGKSVKKSLKNYDGCRIHGSLNINKVAGNIHIIKGKTISLGMIHIHLSSLFDSVTTNFSHRIDKFNFGNKTVTLVHPLEGDERIFTSSNVMVTYFIQVVPTEINNLISKINTFQYSVKENIRPIDHSNGSHGTPGLFFKYDMSALKVIVKQDRDNLVQFLVRLCSIIAGIVVLSGFVNTFVQYLSQLLTKVIGSPVYEKTKKNLAEAPDEIFNLNPISSINELISNTNSEELIVPIDATIL